MRNSLSQLEPRSFVLLFRSLATHHLVRRRLLRCRGERLIQTFFAVRTYHRHKQSRDGCWHEFLCGSGRFGRKNGQTQNKWERLDLDTAFPPTSFTSERIMMSSFTFDLRDENKIPKRLNVGFGIEIGFLAIIIVAALLETKHFSEKKSPIPLFAHVQDQSNATFRAFQHHG